MSFFLDNILSKIPFNGYKTQIAGVVACLASIAEAFEPIVPGAGALAPVLQDIAGILGGVGLTHKAVK